MVDSRFKSLDHPSDIGIVAYGQDNKEIFANAAYGMFSLMANLDGVADEEKYKIKINSDDLDSLLINWLNELIFYQDTKKVLLKEFKIKKLDKNKLEAEVSGEEIDEERHFIYRPIKAATYNQLQIDKNQARIIFDV
ncbi:archease [Candidatus Margulisiibacteriota bacterium]